MFSMSLRLWAGSMSLSRLDQGNLFQQRAEGSERPCHVVIRQRAHTGKREGCIQISDQRSCPSKRSSLRLLRQTPALAPCRSCLPSSCPQPSPNRAFNWNYSARLPAWHAGMWLCCGNHLLGRWQEVARLCPAPAWQCQQPPWVRQRLPSCQTRGEQRGWG